MSCRVEHVALNRNKGKIFRKQENMKQFTWGTKRFEREDKQN